LKKGFKAIFVGMLSCLLALNVVYAQADYANTSEVFNATRAYEQAKLSPDGKHLSPLSRVEGQSTLLIFELRSSTGYIAFLVGKQ
jgi:hypothetical protein